MKFVKVTGKGAQKVHIATLHTGRTMCGTDTSNGMVREVPGPATCQWCYDSLDNLLDALVNGIAEAPGEAEAS